MIVFDLACEQGHRFEGWFASSDDFAVQQQRGLVACPHCGSAQIGKAPMAPAVARKGNQRKASVPTIPAVTNPTLPDQARQMLTRLAELQTAALQKSRWVGKDFVEQSRKMHYGESAVETIHGQATMAEASDLIEEGIAVLPLPLPVAPPEDVN